jgi:hypothetical protein
MKQAAISIIVRAKANIQQTMQDRRVNHEATWPPHSILCNCNKCMKQEFNYIKEMRKENRLAKARQKATN